VFHDVDSKRCNGQVSDLSYLHSRDVTFATFSEGPYEEGARYREFMGYRMPWYSAEPSRDALVAGRGFGIIVCYLREGEKGNTGEQWRINGRPTPQWQRLAAGHSDDARSPDDR